MIEAIGHEIAERIRQAPWADRVAGVVIPYEYESGGKRYKVPLSCDVSGKDCNEGDLTTLLPDQRRRSVIFIEDRTGSRRVGVDGPWINFQSVIRIVGWVNPPQMGIDEPQCTGCTSASGISREIYGMLPNRNENLPACNLAGINFEYYGLAPTGESPWSRYTLNEAQRAFLKPPFQVFGMDLVCTWRIHERCLCNVQVGDPSGCGVPAVIQRRHPKDFTTEELLNPSTGLTQAQLDAIGCDGGTDMPYIKKVFATEAEALADDATIPDNDQAIKVAGRLYQGDGTLTAKGLVEQAIYNPSVTEGVELITTFQGQDAAIQLNAPQ